MVLCQEVGCSDDRVEGSTQLVAHIAHESGFGGGGDLGLLFLGVEEAEDEIKKYDDEEKVQNDIDREMMVINEIGEPVDLGSVGQDKHGHREHQHGRAKGRDDDNVVLSHAEEEDHRHGEWEEIQIGGLAGSLDIAKKERLEVGADDTEYFG